MTGSMASFDTPTTCAVGRAGFDSGPRKLNTVGIPISFRGPPACAIAAWNTGANMNPMPASRRHLDTPSESSATFTPSASKRSADPHRDDAARLPCLATTAPAPAATIAAIVDTLIVPARSPPVPHVSTTGPGTSTPGASSSIAEASPDTSADVSPFDRSATTNAAICAGVASPAMIRRIASAASCDERSSRATRRLRIPGQKSVTAPIPPSAKYPRQGRPNQRQAEQEHQDVPSLDLPRLHGVEAHRPVLRRLPQPVVLTELLFGEPV